MHLVWSQKLPQAFTVRDVHTRLDDLAYTTIMTTVARLAEKGLLTTSGASGHARAYLYRVALDPAAYVRRATEHQVDELVARFGDVALAAFASRLDRQPAGGRRLRRKSA